MQDTRRKSNTSNLDSHSMLIHELLQSSSDWNGTKDIVKLTFKAVLDAIKAQNEETKNLERALCDKVNKNEHMGIISQKASVADVSKTVAEMAADIESRATLKELNKLAANIVTKDELNNILKNNNEVDVKEVVEGNVQKSILKLNNKLEEFNSNSLHTKENIDQLKTDIKVIKKELNKRLNELMLKKVGFEDIKNILEPKNENNIYVLIENKIKELGIEQEKKLLEVRKDINSLCRDIIPQSPNTKTEVSLEQFNELKKNIERLQGELKKVKASIVDLNDEYQRDTQRVISKIPQYDAKKEIIALRKEIELLAQDKSGHKEVQDIKNLVKEKASVEEVAAIIIKSKAEIAQRFVEVLDDNDQTIKKLSSEYSKRKQKAEPIVNDSLDLKEIRTELNILKSQVKALDIDIYRRLPLPITKESVEELKKQLELKADIKDICKLIDTREEALRKEMREKALLKDLKSALTLQAEINDTLGLENCVGRWVWNSGKVIY